MQARISPLVTSCILAAAALTASPGLAKELGFMNNGSEPMHVASAVWLEFCGMSDASGNCLEYRKGWLYSGWTKVQPGMGFTRVHDSEACLAIDADDRDVVADLRTASFTLDGTSYHDDLWVHHTKDFELFLGYDGDDNGYVSNLKIDGVLQNVDDQSRPWNDVNLDLTGLGLISHTSLCTEKSYVNLSLR